MESGIKKAVLYLGVDPKHFKTDKPTIHCPLIEIIPRPSDSMEIKQVFSHLHNYTHIIFTSKSSVTLFFENFRKYGYNMKDLHDKYLIAVGQVAAYYLKNEGAIPTYIAADETAEGVVRVLSSLDLDEANVLLPKSASARPALTHYLVEHDIHYQICTLYDTYNRKPFDLPNLEDVDEIIFTSPATVETFFSLFDEVPTGIDLHPIGIATREALRHKLAEEKHMAITK